MEDLTTSFISSKSPSPGEAPKSDTDIPPFLDRRRPKFQIMPDLSDADYAALRDDIRERGMQVPVEYDQDGNIIDGHHRVRACRELGIADWPRVARMYDDDRARRTQARRLNIARRHLNTDANRELIAAELLHRPEMSNRKVASDLGVSDHTVGRVREELEQGAQIAHQGKRIGKDGVVQAASKPKLSAISLPGPDGRKVIKSAKAEIRRGEILREKEAYEARKESGGTVDDLNQLVASGRLYSVILADPPWTFDTYSLKGKDRSAESHYETSSLQEISKLPVSKLAATDSVLLLWCIGPQLTAALEVIAAWGFEYKTFGFVWIKENRGGQGLFTGMGYWTRSNAEICLLATRGNPKRLVMDVHQVFMSPVREHSRKPDEIGDRVERLLAGPYIELYARHRRPGWTTWGNELEKASSAAD